MSGLRLTWLVLALLFLTGTRAPARAQDAPAGMPAGVSTNGGQPASGKAGTGTGPKITCFGGPNVLTCLDNAGGPPFQVNCFGSSAYQTCFSFESNKQFSVSSLGGSNVRSGPGSDPASRPPAAASSGSTPARASSNP